MAGLESGSGLAIGLYAGVQQLRQPSEGRIAETLARAKELPWDGFRAALEGAHARVYVAVGEITDSARAFAEERRIRLLQEQELAKMLAGQL